jgi:hypothetical protein
MIYTINGKEYTEFGINKAIAHILHNDSSVVRSIKGADMVTVEGRGFAKIMLDYCKNPSDTWPIIEKVFDFLESRSEEPLQSVWQWIMEKHNCTKLIAACICFIELKEQGQ